MNVKEAVQEVRKKLAENNIDTPLLDAQLMVGKAADMTRVEILTYPDKTLDENEICKINEMCSERIKHKPMQYILGVCEFMGLDYYKRPLGVLYFDNVNINQKMLNHGGCLKF